MGAMWAIFGYVSLISPLLHSLYITLLFIARYICVVVYKEKKECEY